METQLMFDNGADFDLWTFASYVMNWLTWVIDVCDLVCKMGAAICVAPSQTALSKAWGQ